MPQETHTPGPWIVTDVPTDSQRWFDVENVTPDGEADYVIARVWADASVLPAEANAHLIAAAPELLEALKVFMTCYPAAITALSDEMRQRIEGAIAKAEGRS